MNAVDQAQIALWDYGEPVDVEMRNPVIRRLFLETNLAYFRAHSPTAKMLMNRALREWRLVIRVPGLEPIHPTLFVDTRCSAMPEWGDVRLLQPMCGEAFWPLSPLMIVVMSGIQPIAN